MASGQMPEDAMACWTQPRGSESRTAPVVLTLCSILSIVKLETPGASRCRGRGRVVCVVGRRRRRLSPLPSADLAVDVRLRLAGVV